MPATVDGLRFPHERVLLQRTKLAYIHLGNLLTDAKRDRAARVFGYVAVWLPDELLVLYMQEGELVNATRTVDGTRYEPLPIAEAVGRVPAAAEYGAICFHEAPDEQLACMYAAQCTADEGWPPGLPMHEAATLFPYLNAQMYDGMVEIVADGVVNYLVFRNGIVQRAFMAGRGASLAEQTARLFEGDPARRRVRRWPVPPPVPVQAPPPLIAAYREFTTALVERLVAAGGDGAPAIADHARRTLAGAHPCLESFAPPTGRTVRDPVVDAPTLTAGVAAWVTETLWAAGPSADIAPEALLADLTRERRHMFQSSGFCDALPWKIAW